MEKVVFRAPASKERGRREVQQGGHSEKRDGQENAKAKMQKREEDKTKKKGASRQKGQKHP